MSEGPRFLADSMLGKLARWLILLGYDARYASRPGQPDLELLEEAHREGRVFLTQDRKIPAVAGLRMVVVTGKRFEDQILQLKAELGLKPDRAKLFTRCTYCNEPLTRLTKEEALPLVPPLVRELDTPFFRCAKCRRLYWNGTHTERTIKRLDKLGL